MELRDNRLTSRADLLASKQARISSAFLDFFSASSEVARYAPSDSSTGEGVDSVAGSADFCASPSGVGSAVSSELVSVESPTSPVAIFCSKSSTKFGSRN